MALKGIKVIELAGLAPTPFCGMMLADFGAEVIRIDRIGQHLLGQFKRSDRGKYSIALDLKKPDGVNILNSLTTQADVLIEPYRPGVMEKLGLGPKILMDANPRLIYARLTGYGTDGPFAHKAGHDINYLAVSGILSQLGRKDDIPYPPVNLLADFAGGGLMCMTGILLALYERMASGKGQVVDCSMTEGASAVGTFLWNLHNSAFRCNERGENVLDGGAHFYEVYLTNDGKYMAVGALEPKFYRNLLKGLGLSIEDHPQSLNCQKSKEKFKELFVSKSQDEWTKIFDGLDACVTAVVDLTDAHEHVQSKARSSFVLVDNGNIEPGPAPRLQRTPGLAQSSTPTVGQHTNEILQRYGFTNEQVKQFEEHGAIFQNYDTESKL
ncbi:alpha-methylacyl-CoA racemase-like [Tubulanus polymorphus]|uniref:alpha-methylacyl-CoA racemase-like n=1 Tax=Tubulanus polymorphus TaxID=672921 RepID=UPI003DA49F7E